MAQQAGGWPLGLQPLNVRVGVIRNVDFSGSTSFSTLMSGSPTSFSDSSSDLDTESTGSFFQDRSITLGRLIGITSILDLSSNRSISKQDTRGKKSKQKGRIWFSLCSRARADGDIGRNTPSLADFLEVERRANSNSYGRNRVPVTYELDGLPESHHHSVQEANSLFSNGCIAPPRSGCIDSSVVVGGKIKHQVCCW